jgi:hypothetical protein
MFFVIKNKIIFLLVLITGLHSGFMSGQASGSFPISKQDSIRHRNIKINPVKLAFNEISVDYEHFRKPIKMLQPSEDLKAIDSIIIKRKTERISSTNYIIGLIYPSDINHLIEYKDQIHYTCVQYLDDAGISPFINWGLSLKLDFRRYRNNFYWGPEFMEKFVFYTKKWVDNQSGNADEPSERLQSGYANIIGFGYFIGWQMERKGFVTDLFFGAGARYRSAIRKIWEEHFYQGGPTILYPDPKTENLSRAYPSINFGIRLGFTL